jgi:tetratricopeptide (TPR) repeat protein
VLYSNLLIGDARGYDLWAKELAAGDWIGQEIFYQAPLYPYLLGIVYALCGPSILAVRVIQAATGAVSCALLASAGGRMFSPRVGAIAGVIMALYAPAIFFDGLIQKSAVDLFFVTALLWLLSRTTSESKPLAWATIGAVLGGFTLTRENALILAAATVAWLLVNRHLQLKRNGIRALAVAGGVAAVLFPVALRNYLVGGEFHLTTSQFGPNFYIGNGPSATGKYVPLVSGRGDPRYERKDAEEIAVRETGRSLTPREVSSHWVRKAFKHIASHPGDWFRVIVKKVVLLISAVEVVDTEDLYAYANWSTPLWICQFAFHMGVVAPLAVFGFWSTWRLGGPLSLTRILALAYACGVLAFYVVARYRFPLAPFLILFAAAALVEVLSRIRAGGGAGLRIAIAVALGVGVLSNWPWSFTSKSRMQAVSFCNWGGALYEQENLTEAVEAYRESLALNPDYAPSHYGIGLTLSKLNHRDLAIDHYREAVRINPEFVLARMNLAKLLLSRGEHDQAIDLYQEILRNQPNNSIAHFNLAVALMAAEKRDEAIEHYREAILLGKSAARAHFNLGLLFQEQGDFETAAVHFDSAIETDPDHAKARYSLALMLARLGRWAEANEHFQIVIRLETRRVDYLAGMAQALMSVESPAIDAAKLAAGLAERAAELTDGQDALVLRILADAYFASNRSAEGLVTAERALKLAQQSRQQALVEGIRKILSKYDSNRTR